MDFFRKSKISLGFQVPFGIQKDVAELILANFDFWPLPSADIWANSPKKGKIKDFLNVLSAQMGKSLSTLNISTRKFRAFFHSLLLPAAFPNLVEWLVFYATQQKRSRFANICCESWIIIIELLYLPAENAALLSAFTA